jgi:putative ABC transport system permease protein
MNGRNVNHSFRPHLWLIRLIGVIVPRRLRADWRQEWESELRNREMLLAEWDRLDWRNKLDLLRRSIGAFRDALLLQPRRLEDEMFRDLRFGIRMLLKNKSFTAVAVLSLALGIGANTAIFQLLDAVRLRTLPVKAPQELAEVRIADMTGARGNFSSSFATVTNPIWEQIRDRQQAFSGVLAWSTDGLNLSPGGEVRSAQALWVSGGFFNVLGVQPALGRVFTAADDQRGCGAPGVVISHRFWQREYGGDANVIGRKLTLDDRPLEIIGVAPASFFGLEVGRSFDVAAPICAEAVIRGDNNRLASGTSWWLTVMGRLKPGWSPEQATAHLQAISPGLFEATLPANYPTVNVKNYLGFKLSAVTAGTGVSMLRRDYEQSLWLLLAIAGLVLLIACVNLANLLLARASAREREIAVRQALGARRGRLIRQLLVESLLLAVVGAGLGAGLAQALSRLLVSFLSASNGAVILDLAPDWRVLGFAAGLAILTCILFGLAPALRATRIEPGAVMKASGRGLTAGRATFHSGFSLRRALVAVQVALSLVLVTGAFLFSRSLNKLITVDAGLRQEGILIADVGFRRLNVPTERRLAFKNELLARIRAIPGVEAATDTTIVPLGNSSSSNTVWLDGADSQQKRNTRLSGIGPDYFKTLGTRILAGREFDERDATGAPNVAIVNEAFARVFLNGAHPVGRSFRIEETASFPETRWEIVGLARDTKYGELSEEFGPIIFLPAAQHPRPNAGGQFLIRSSLPQAEIVAAVRRVLAEASPAIGVSFQGFKTMIEETVLRERLLATLSGFFGLLALLLACIGLYGILSYSVASRTNEIGIRMALGARQRDVLWLVLREALLMIIAGVAVGLPMIWATTRLASTLLFGLTPTDPVSLLLAASLMITVATVAGYLPARRATRVDPMVALRYE